MREERRRLPMWRVSSLRYDYDTMNGFVIENNMFNVIHYLM